MVVITGREGVGSVNGGCGAEVIKARDGATEWEVVVWVMAASEWELLSDWVCNGRLLGAKSESFVRSLAMAPLKTNRLQISRFFVTCPC